ncbi:MAG: DNA polymerase III subunit delta [Acidobacteria bacterium]|nr:DNA polymerase III subunit delta [Acidobacteriota bacterium]
MDINLLTSLEQQLRRGKVRPVYLFLGPEDYLVKRALDLFRRTIVGEELLAFNLVSFEAGSADMSEVFGAARTMPMMAGRRLVILKQIEELPAEARSVLTAYLDRPSECSVLVLTAADIDRRTTFFKVLQEKTEILECPRLKRPEIERWAAGYIRSLGFRISSPALSRLLDTVGADLQMLASEMEKITLLAGADRSIPDSAVDELAASTRHRGIFELTGAIGRRDVRTALRVLGSLLDAGESPIGIAAMMARHYRQVIVAREMLDGRKSRQEISAATQVPQFALDEFIRQARALDSGTAKRLYVRLAEMDRLFKSANVDERIVLESLICSL